MKWKKVMPLLKQAQELSGRSKADILQDLYKCYKKNYSWANYFAFDFANNTSEDYRRSFICVGRHYPLITKAFNLSSEMTPYFEDKGLFIKNFGDLRGIDALDLRQADLSDFQRFVSNHEAAFIKQVDQSGGDGVEHVVLADLVKDGTKKAYDDLKAQNFFVIEEVIHQHPHVAQLSLNAVNTLRVVTCRPRANIINIPFVASRISVTDSYKDSGSLGGAFCIVDEEGYIRYDYFSYLPILETFSENPYTGFQFKGFQFPFLEEAKALCTEAALRCKEPYIGWDVAITEKGPILIEANRAPGTNLIQAINQLPDHRGRLSELEEALEMKLWIE